MSKAITINCLGSDYTSDGDGYLYQIEEKVVEKGNILGNLKVVSTIYPVEITIKFHSTEEYSYAYNELYTINKTIHSAQESGIINIDGLYSDKMTFIARVPYQDYVNEFKVDFDYSPASALGESNSNFIMYESKSGYPYAQHDIGSYSEYEFAQKTELHGRSGYAKKRMASPVMVGHFHENERGFLRNLYAGTRLGKTHGNKLIKDKTIDGTEAEYVYLDLIGNTINMFSQSNRVIRSVIMKTKEMRKLGKFIRISFKKREDENDEFVEAKESEFFFDTSYVSYPVESTLIVEGDVESQNKTYGLLKIPEDLDRTLEIKLDEGDVEDFRELYYQLITGNFKLKLLDKETGLLLNNNIAERTIEDTTRGKFILPRVVYDLDYDNNKVKWKYKNIPSSVAIEEGNGSYDVNAFMSGRILLEREDFNYDLQNFNMEDYITAAVYYDAIKTRFIVKFESISVKSEDTGVIYGSIQLKSPFDTVDKVSKFEYTMPDNVYQLTVGDKIYLLNESKSSSVDITGEGIEDTPSKVYSYFYDLVLRSLYVKLVAADNANNVLASFNHIDVSSYNFSLDALPNVLTDSNGYNYQKPAGLQGALISTLSTIQNTRRETYAYTPFLGRYAINFLDKSNGLKISYDNYDADFCNKYYPSNVLPSNPLEFNNVKQLNYTPPEDIVINENFKYVRNFSVNEPNTLVKTPQSPNEIESFSVNYDLNIVNPVLYVTMRTNGCSFKEDERLIIVDSSNKIVAFLYGQSGYGEFVNEANSGIFIEWFDVTDEYGNLVDPNDTNIPKRHMTKGFKITVDITNPNRAARTYKCYGINTTGNSHSCENGSYIKYENIAGVRRTETYYNYNYPVVPSYVDNISVSYDSTTRIPSISGGTPKLVLGNTLVLPNAEVITSTGNVSKPIQPLATFDTGKNTTSTVFDFNTPVKYAPQS